MTMYKHCNLCCFLAQGLVDMRCTLICSAETKTIPNEALGCFCFAACALPLAHKEGYITQAKPQRLPNHAVIVPPVLTICVGERKSTS